MSSPETTKSPLRVKSVPVTAPVNVAPAPAIAVAEMPVEKDPLAPSISPVTLPVKAPSKAAETIPVKVPEVPETIPLKVKPAPDTCPVKVAVAPSISVEEIPVEKDPLAPSISPVTSPVRAPSKAAETIPLKCAAVPEAAIPKYATDTTVKSFIV